MDDIEQRLKADAEAIRADVTPELESRIRASLAAAHRPARPRERAPGRLFWVASALTGAAAAAAALLLLDRTAPPAAPVEDPGEAVAVTVPEPGDPGVGVLPLEIRNADLTRPLEEELGNLKSDLEKAREGVERDVRFMF